MKTKSFIFASLTLAAGAMLTGCVQDTQPRIEIPAPGSFVLNTPPLTESTYLLTSGADIELSWSQPDYGLGICPNYYIDFSKSETFTRTVAEGEEVEGANVGDEVADYATYNTVFTVAKVALPATDFCLQLQEYMGWEDEDAVPTDPVDIYFRVRSEVPNFPAGDITSNAIKINMIPFYVSLGPDAIFLIGQPQGWNNNASGAEGWELWETEEGSKIYKGSFDIKAGEFQFRFYDKVGDWESYSIGSQDEDSPIDISEEMASGTYSGPCFYDPSTPKAGKGSWSVPDWAGGPITITVDLNAMTVLFEAGAETNYIYLIGDPEGWDINGSDKWRLAETAMGSNVYSGTFEIPEGKFTLRFYSEPGDWDWNSIGAQDEDEAVSIAMPYSGPCIYDPTTEKAGKGGWTVPGWPGGKVTFTVDLNNLTVDFAIAE